MLGPVLRPLLDAGETQHPFEKILQPCAVREKLFEAATIFAFRAGVDAAKIADLTSQSRRTSLARERRRGSAASVAAKRIFSSEPGEFEERRQGEQAQSCESEQPQVAESSNR